MANQKISELTALLGSNVADDDALAIVDTSTTETKKIAFSQLKLALDTSTGFVRITGDTMTGNLTVPNLVTAGNVDGRDVSADGSKLDGIEASADVTDTANVTAAGALMDSEVTNLAQVKAFDSSDYATAAQGATADAAMPKAGGTFTGDALFSDNVKATFGAGSDLQIYHDGSNSYVDDTGDGALILRGNNNVTIGKYTGETMGYFEADGAAYLYHNNAIKFQTSSIGSQTDQLFGISDADTGIALGANGADIMQFYTGNNERARLTDGGDLLVAKSSGGLANVGHELDAEGYAYHTRDGGVPLYVNRKTNDGNFVQFYKDQANIGSVGNNGTNFIFKGEHSSGVVQLQSHNGNEDIEVGDGKIVFEAGGSERMRLTDNGLTFNGDTAAANALNDYEEGTWTPAPGSGGWILNSAKYVKIGGFVHCSFYVTATSTVSSADFTGLPFTPSQDAAGIVGYQDQISGEVLSVYVQTTNVWNLRIGSTQYGLDSGKTIRGSFTYPTNS